MDKNQILSILYDVVSLRKENGEWLDKRLKGVKEPETLEYFKRIMGTALSNMKLGQARKALADFRKISKEEELCLDLMIYYVETGTQIAEDEGDLYSKFYESMENMFINVICILDKNPPLLKKFKPRLAWIVNHATEGWGYRDTLEDYFEEVGKGTLGERDED